MVTIFPYGPMKENEIFKTPLPQNGIVKQLKIFFIFFHLKQ